MSTRSKPIFTVLTVSLTLMCSYSAYAGTNTGPKGLATVCEIDRNSGTQSPLGSDVTGYEVLAPVTPINEGFLIRPKLSTGKAKQSIEVTYTGDGYISYMYARGSHTFESVCDTDSLGISTCSFYADSTSVCFEQGCQPGKKAKTLRKNYMDFWSDVGQGVNYQVTTSGADYCGVGNNAVMGWAECIAGIIAGAGACLGVVTCALGGAGAGMLCGEALAQ